MAYEKKRRYTADEAATITAPWQYAQLVDVTTNDWSDDGFAPTGMIIGVTGFIKLRLAGMDAGTYITLYLLEGVPYGLQVVEILTTGTDLSIRDKIWIFR